MEKDFFDEEKKRARRIINSWGWMWSESVSDDYSWSSRCLTPPRGAASSIDDQYKALVDNRSLVIEICNFKPSPIYTGEKKTATIGEMALLSFRCVNNTSWGKTRDGDLVDLLDFGDDNQYTLESRLAFAIGKIWTYQINESWLSTMIRWESYGEGSKTKIRPELFDVLLNREPKDSFRLKNINI